jgi:hypothetical protein
MTPDPELLARGYSPEAACPICEKVTATQVLCERHAEQEREGYVLPEPVHASPDDPIIHGLRWREERDRFRSELSEAHNWLLASGFCDCEDRGYEGRVRCRFAEALDAGVQP